MTTKFGRKILLVQGIGWSNASCCKVVYLVRACCCCAAVLQVLGHTKTVLVLLISWAVLHEHMSARKLSGMLLAVAGMVAYGYFNSQSSSSNSKFGSEKAAQDSLPILSRASKSAADLPTVLTAGVKNPTAEKRLTAVPSSGSMAQITVVAR